MKLGPFRLGMTLAQVEALLTTRSDLFSAPASAFGGGSTVCDPRTTSSSRTRIYRYIPADIGIRTRSGGHYALQFEDVGGTTYVTSIYWSPPPGLYTKPSWLAFLAKRFGPYSGTVSSEDTLRVHWCTRGEERCEEDRQRDLPELIMNSDSNEGDIAITLRAGRRFEGAVPAALTPMESAGDRTCRLAPNAGPEGLFDQYLLGLSQPTGFGTAAAYREKMLPAAVRSAHPADGFLRWARRQGSAWLVRWTMPGEDHGVAVEIGVDIYFLLEPAGRAYRAVWTGDEAAFRKKFGLATRPMLREGLGPA
jgi:hypothetical protein